MHHSLNRCPLQRCDVSRLMALYCVVRLLGTERSTREHSELRELSINRLKTANDQGCLFETMEEGQLPSPSRTRPPAGIVCYLPNGEFYVQACLPGANFCPRPRVSPGLDAAAAEHRSGSALLDAVDLIDSSDDDDEEEEEGGDAQDLPDNMQLDGSALLDAVGAIDSDDDVEEIDVSSKRQETAPPSRLQGAVDAMDSDDEGHLKRHSDPPERRTPFISGAALDLCPTIDLMNMPDTDSSSSSCCSSSEDEDDESDNSGVEGDGEGSDDERAVSAPRLSSWESDYLPVSQVDAIIRSNMAEIEAKKPWRFVFRCLEVPFAFKRRDDPFDVFFMRWDEFWRVHGRAVWERDFWQPLIPGSTEYHRRKGRQFRAQRAFRELATDLEERLGKNFRRWLATTPHDGWWYRVEPFALRRMFLKNRRLYAGYLEDRVRDRWPRGRRFLVARGLKPMWWLSDFGSSATDDEL